MLCRFRSERDMHTGEQLGAAIDAARKAKGLSKKALAERFGVAQPSVQGWIRTGRIEKNRLLEVMGFFAGTVGPEHWGLPSELPAGLGAGGTVIERMVVMSRDGVLDPEDWKLVDDLLSALERRRPARSG